MGFFIVFIVLLVSAALFEKRKSEGIRTRMGWLKPGRCSNCGVTLRFQPFNGQIRSGL